MLSHLFNVGLNTRAFIIRISDWCCKLVKDMASYGRHPVDWSKDAAMHAALPAHDMDMYGQNAHHLQILPAGLNTGTVIIRNSDWSRKLVEDMATYGKYPVDWSKEATLRAAVPTYDMGMYEQNVLIYRITSDPTMLEKVCAHT